MEQIEIDKIDQNLGQQWNIGDSQLINQNNKNIKERKKEKKKLEFYSQTGWNHNISQNLIEQTKIGKIDPNLSQRWNINDSQLIIRTIRTRGKKNKLVIYSHTNQNHNTDRNLIKHTKMDRLDQNLG